MLQASLQGAMYLKKNKRGSIATAEVFCIDQIIISVEEILKNFFCILENIILFSGRYV